MNNKYYIPSIDEFCVGFEYQELVTVPTYVATRFNGYCKSKTLRDCCTN